MSHTAWRTLLSILAALVAYIGHPGSFLQVERKGVAGAAVRLTPPARF